MNKITFRELVDLMREDKIKVGYIVYSQDNWDKEFSLESRTYKVSSTTSNYFQNGKISNSIWGSSLDGTDVSVRLDWYKWKIEYCYYEEEV